MEKNRRDRTGGGVLLLMSSGDEIELEGVQDGFPVPERVHTE